MYRKYRLEHRHINDAIEDAKQRLIAISHRLKRYDARNEQFLINKQFQNNPQKVYKQFRKESDKKSSFPNKDATMRYWRDIWERPVDYNENASWLNEITEDNQHTREQRSVQLTERDVKNKLASMSNWKGPGPDQVQTFRVKKLTRLHKRLATEMNNVLNHPQNMPNWLIIGTTVLIQKDLDKEATPSNFRPITCLPTMWKILSGILANKILRHLTENCILCYEQKGARPFSRGTKDQLAIDRTITRENKKRNKNLAMAWIDYRKAYDSVPHSWIMKCLEMYKVDQKIYQVIEASMKEWKTTLTCGKETFGDIRIRRGIFQGDALSPVLFCMALNPLSEVLHKAGKEYALHNGMKINHLLYMDDLKLYSKKESDITSLINTVKIFSQDINMQFGIDKCAKIIVQRGKVKTTTGIEVDGATIQDVEQDGYKYLGIMQYHVNLDNVAKTKARESYKKRLRKILRSKLYAKNKIQAINQFAVPVIMYTGGVVKWTKDELRKINTMTRKLMTMYEALHPRADVDRLYVPRSLGGRGLKDLATVIESENRSLTEYIRQKEDDPLLGIVRAGELYPENDVPHEEWKDRTVADRVNSWTQKPMHGQYPRQIENITKKTNAYSWLKEANLKIQTEALMIAAQDQSLNTKAHKTHIMKISTDPRCRMCGSADETVAHILAGCSQLAGTQYLARHNEVAKILHYNMCVEYGVAVPKNYWRHQPLNVTETSEMKLLWDYEIQTDRRIQARRPDLVLVNKTQRNAIIIDIAVPEDRNIAVKEREKIDKYQDLCLEIKRLWNVKTQVIPIVIGAMGSHSNRLQDYLSKTPGTHRKVELVKAALIGSAHILRRVLSLPESW